jgi:hypothetical protein
MLANWTAADPAADKAPGHTKYNADVGVHWGQRTDPQPQRAIGRGWSLDASTWVAFVAAPARD